MLTTGKLNNAPDIEWRRSYGGKNQEYFNSMVQTNDGGYIIAGITTTSQNGDVTGGYGDYDCWIVKLSNCLNGVEAGISITTTDDETICPGTSLSFTSSVMNEGKNPVYEWRINGVTVGHGPTLTTNHFVPGFNRVTCELMSDAQPCVYNRPAISNIIIIKVLAGANVNLGMSGTKFINQPLQPNEVDAEANVNINPGDYEFTWQDGSKTPTYRIKIW